jgi:hypothetical protein
MADVATSAYPIVLSIGRPESLSRFWAIPFIGIFVKAIILIPHYVILGVLGWLVGLCQLIVWIPVLFTGHYPDWAFGLVAGDLRWTTRVTLYLYGVTDQYPSFSMDAPGDMYIARPQSSSRFFAIPFIGVFVKGIILIPHFIVLYVLSIVVALCQLVVWIPVLFTGQYPSWAFPLVTGTTLWAMRVYAYLLGLTDSYPPFSFS